MKNVFKLTFLLLTMTTMFAQADKVSVVKDDSGMKLVVNGENFMINGMNWDYFPIGTNYTYSLWKQPDDLIKAALDEEMALLKNMGVNVIRQYTGVPPKWIQYIYENYGIYTMLNHSFGRYGLTIDGAWVANTEYSDPRAQKLLLKEVKEMSEKYKDTPGLLMFLLGNENNYGLFWAGAETEDFPDEEEKKQHIGEVRGRPMYKLMNDAAVAMKAIDSSHPVAICNGDLLFLNIIKEECKDVDIYGTNVYRGISFGDAFQKIKDELNKPIMFTEFGADAFNAITNEEDQQAQAYYLVGNWKEIYENAAGLGKAGNSIGGFTFQFSDGWWKYGQTKNLDKHDNNASWSNGGYQKDFLDGQNNMNEEWFGICAKGQTNAKGLYQLYPRAAYYALQEVHRLNPYNKGATLASVDQYFDGVEVMGAVLKARGDKASLVSELSKRIRISNFRAEFETFNTGGDLISTPVEEGDDINGNTYPNKRGFDHMESYYVGIEANPTSNVRANINFNILGNVATNPINEIFYENRGRSREFVTSDDGTVTLDDIDRLKVYNASFEWNHKLFDLNGFYRTGHYHWGYEGDFFGLYPEANYGPNLDIYNGETLGFEVDGKQALEGFKAAFGRQLWWGANPAFLLKYRKQIGRFDVAAIYHEDIDNAEPAVSSIAVPQPQTRRVTLSAKTKIGDLGVQVGGIWGGQPLNGRTFQIARGEPGNYTIYDDQVKASDNWGGKLKLTYSKGPISWYLQSAIMGLVANGGTDYTKTYTGWRLKDSGSGNQQNVLGGFAYKIGNFEIAPNFLWQKPIVDPMPGDVQAPGRLRNILDDPFSVRQNRETYGSELLLTYDPTPGTWMHEWNSDEIEDAKFAASVGAIYRHMPTSMDAAIGILPDGRTTFAFPGAAGPADLWEGYARIVSKLNPNFGIIANLYGGEAQANGDSQRIINRYGLDLRMIYRKIKLISAVKINDWGPYDYHRDFNQTFPVQLMADLSTSVGKPSWFILPDTKIGIRGTWRTLDQYSPRYCPVTDATGQCIATEGYDDGNEWEIRTYIKINIGK
ncbi:beta-glucuronidase [Flavobacteriaceae bacterium UJ101]|nr:beta-glucuronidase [Flavobacteriaceae bacterium UJ101]